MRKYSYETVSIFLRYNHKFHFPQPDLSDIPNILMDSGRDKTNNFFVLFCHKNFVRIAKTGVPSPFGIEIIAMLGLQVGIYVKTIAIFPKPVSGDPDDILNIIFFKFS